MSEGPKEIDEVALRRWLEKYGFPIASAGAKFDRDRFYAVTAMPSRPPRRHILSWVGGAAVLLLTVMGASVLFHDYPSASSGPSATFSALHQSAAEKPMSTKLYMNPQFGFSLQIPEFLTSYSGYRNDGRIWQSTHPAAHVLAYGEYNTTHETISSLQHALAAGAHVSYKRGTDWLAVSRVVGDMVDYQKIFVGTRFEYVLTIRYPEAERVQDQSWVAELANSFKPGRQ